MSRPPFNLEAVETATRLGLSRGYSRIFQPHRYADDDADHVRVIAQHLLPAPGNTVVDVGCGVGEVARHLAEMDPDLRFILVNISPYQLSLCPKGERFMPVLGDWHEIELQDESADVVMFHAALCQMDIDRALEQAHRVLRPGGILVVHDMFRVQGDGREWEELLAARVLTVVDLCQAIRRRDFILERVETPAVFDDAHLKQLLAQNGLRHLAHEVRPVIVRAVKDPGGDMHWRKRD